MKKKQPSKIIALIIASCMVLAVLLSAAIPMITEAASQAELKKQLEQGEADLKQKKARLQNVRSNISSTQADINSIDQEIARAESEISALEAAIAQTQQEIEETTVKLDEAEAECERFTETFKETGRVMYENRTTSYLEVLFGAESFSDFLNRLEMIRSVMNYDREILDEMVAKKEAIAALKEELENKKAEQESSQALLANKKEQLAVSKETKEALLGDLREDEKAAQQEVEASEEEVESVRRQINSLLAQDTSGITYTGNGKLGWPVPGRYGISSYYGYRIHPISGVKKFHSGIDIPAPTGTSIVAAEDGVVIFAGWRGGYGNAVIINHGSGITTLYGHNSSITVSVGQKVSRGQTIAKAGSTGNSTGPHCHFEVQVGGNRQNPLSYVR